MILESTIQQVQQATTTMPSDRDERSKGVKLVGSVECSAVPPGMLFAATTATKQRVHLRVLDTIEQPDGVQVQLVDGESINIHPIDSRGDKIQLNCTCEDFTFRLARANSSAGVLFGSISKPYIKKTSSPASNTSIGMCKHLMKLIATLTASGIIK
jgi:hypothetical protein